MVRSLTRRWESASCSSAALALRNSGSWRRRPVEMMSSRGMWLRAACVRMLRRDDILSSTGRQSHKQRQQA
eukprot:14185781-Alexandrium_andersonii.AAC.1